MGQNNRILSEIVCAKCIGCCDHFLMNLLVWTNAGGLVCLISDFRLFSVTFTYLQYFTL